jgi:hypothetical protein
VRAVFVACAILLPGATLAAMTVGGCESTAHIDVPVYEAGVIDVTVLPLPDTGPLDSTTDASADGPADATMDAGPDAAGDGGPTLDGESSDAPSKDGRAGDAEGSDAHGDSAADAMKPGDAALDGTEADTGEKG